MTRTYLPYSFQTLTFSQATRKWVLCTVIISTNQDLPIISPPLDGSHTWPPAFGFWLKMSRFWKCTKLLWFGPWCYYGVFLDGFQLYSTSQGGVPSDTLGRWQRRHKMACWLVGHKEYPGGVPNRQKFVVSLDSSTMFHFRGTLPYCPLRSAVMVVLDIIEFLFTAPRFVLHRPEHRSHWIS